MEKKKKILIVDDDREFVQAMNTQLRAKGQKIHLLGGKIEVESEPGKGSTFTVEIPAGN